MRNNNRTSHAGCPLAIAACVFLLATQTGYAQEFRWPEEPQNLKVLPEGTKGAELGKIMRGFAGSLGVRCEHCHVGEGPNLAEFDFAADDKATKRKARIMLEMVKALNSEHLTKLSAVDDEKTPALEVTCMTCHRRNARPVMLPDILVDTIDTEGIDAAEAKYRELREQYYGGFTYDFSAGSLTGLGERLGEQGDFDSAIRIIQMEIEMSGESPGAYYTLGGIQASAELVPDAIESFTKGMAMAPDGWKPFFQSELDKLNAR